MEFAVVRLAFDRSCAEERFSLFLWACVIAVMWCVSWIITAVSAGIWIVLLSLRVVMPLIWRWRVAMVVAIVPLWVSVRLLIGS